MKKKKTARANAGTVFFRKVSGVTVSLKERKVLMELGVHDPLEKANVSTQGKYVSFGVSTVVDSREAMERIDRELRLIEGVKMVL